MRPIVTLALALPLVFSHPVGAVDLSSSAQFKLDWELEDGRSELSQDELRRILVSVLVEDRATLSRSDLNEILRAASAQRTLIDFPGQADLRQDLSLGLDVPSRLEAVRAQLLKVSYEHEEKMLLSVRLASRLRALGRKEYADLVALEALHQLELVNIELVTSNFTKESRVAYLSHLLAAALDGDMEHRAHVEKMMKSVISPETLRKSRAINFADARDGAIAGGLTLTTANLIMAFLAYLSQNEAAHGFYMNHGVLWAFLTLIVGPFGVGAGICAAIGAVDCVNFNRWDRQMFDTVREAYAACARELDTP